MERERLGRLLSLGMVPCGLALLALALLVGDVAFAVIGVVGVGSGVALYRGVDVIFDPDAEFDLRSDQSSVVVLTQLAMTLIAFDLLAYLVGDIGAMTGLFRTGLPEPAFPAYLGVVAGTVLGGGVALLTQRSTAFAEWSTSFHVTMLGHSLTLGTFLVLLLVQPPSSLLYAAAYTLSRLAVVLGIYLRS